MRRCVVVLAMAVTVLAQDTPVVPQSTTVRADVPIRVALEHRVPVRRVGEPVRGRLVEPVYVFDRVALPAGTIVDGHIAEIGGIPFSRRLTAILSGNLTPPRDARAQFDALTLSDGSRLALHTSLSRGAARTSRIAAKGKTKAALQDGGLSLVRGMNPAILAFSAPGKISRLGSYMSGMLPYHRQAWTAGTLFNAVLLEPLTGLPVIQSETLPDRTAIAAAASQEIRARLLAPLSSATARRGAPLEAVVTEPRVSPGNTLLIPEGSRLFGEVVAVQPARLFHRAGKVLFVFHQIQLPSGAKQEIQGYLEGLEANLDAHLAIDSEGAVRTSNPKTRFIFPAIALTVAGLSLHQDYNAQGIPDQDIVGRAESGAVGLGLIGTVLAQTSRTLASSIAFVGAGFGIYSAFVARGEDVFLPANTPITVDLSVRGGESAATRPAK